MSDTSSFLGTGWGFPPTFTRGGGDVQMMSGPEDIHESLQILFSTQPGERLMQDAFGMGWLEGGRMSVKLTNVL